MKQDDTTHNNLLLRALRGFVLAPGVLPQGHDVPEHWFQYRWGETFQRITPALSLDAIGDSCEQLIEQGLQPCVVVPDARSSALFCVNEQKDASVSIDYYMLESQRLAVRELLAQPDPAAILAWQSALAQEDGPIGQWPCDIALLRAFGQRWKRWTEDLFDEAPPVSPFDRVIHATEFQRIGDHEGFLFFRHRAVPFLLLGWDPSQEKLFADGALDEVPDGIEFGALMRDHRSVPESVAGSSPIGDSSPREVTVSDGIWAWVDRGLRWVRQSQGGVDHAYDVLEPATQLNAADGGREGRIAQFREKGVDVIAQDLRADDGDLYVTLRWLDERPSHPPEVLVALNGEKLDSVPVWSDWLDVRGRGQELRIHGINLNLNGLPEDAGVITLAWDTARQRLLLDIVSTGQETPSFQ